MELVLSDEEILFLIGLERFFAFGGKDTLTFFDAIRHRPFEEKLLEIVLPWDLVKSGHVTSEWKITPLGREAINHYLRRKLCQDSPQG